MKPYKFYYNKQFRKYISMFLRIFSGIQVEYGVDRDEDGSNDRKTVNVHYGSMDRIIANVLMKKNTFQSKSLPVLAGWMTQVEINDEKRLSPHHRENVVRIDESTGDKKAVSRIMGVPYRVTIDLTIYASNSDQQFQILEQILLMFNPYLVIQKDDQIDDWNYLTRIKLEAINNEENFPVGPDIRVLSTTMTFIFDAWLNFPVIDQSKIIETIEVNMKDNTFDPLGANLDNDFIVS